MPPRFWVGVVAVLLSWWGNWGLEGLRTQWLFFPLWTGYCLAVDGLVYARTGTSLWARGRAGYVGLFSLSAPLWWLFEGFNLRTQNWIYLGREQFTHLEFFLFSTLSFSTVLPAVFGTAELTASGRVAKLLNGKFRLGQPRRIAGWLFICGLVLLPPLVAWPRVFYPLVWIVPFALLEPVNFRMGRSDLLGRLARGDWSPVLSLMLGTLFCGFFWEFWNYYSYPKWAYHLPGVDFWHVFEMPALGYLGYLPFGLDLWALYHLVTGMPKKGGRSKYLRL